MAKSSNRPADSGDADQDQPGNTVATVEDPIEGELVAAAQRAAVYIQERGFGPNTTSLIMHIAQRAVSDADLNVVILEQLSERLLNATSVDDILQPFDPQSGKEHYGKPLFVTGVSFLESDYEGFPWFVSLECKTPATGEMYVVTVGGEKVVMQAAAIDRANLFPAYFTIAQSDKETKAGYRPLELRPAVKF